MTNPADIARALSEAQRSVILALGSERDFGYKSFKHLGAELGISRDDIAATVLPLKRVFGLLSYAIGLVKEDGTLYGSGYALNDSGLAVRDYLLHRPTSDASTDRNQATVGGCGKGIE